MTSQPSTPTARSGRRADFELDDAQLDELERRMAEADMGEVEPAEAVLAKLRRE